MPGKLGPQPILSLRILIVAISTVSGYLNFRTPAKQLVETMALGADELSCSIISATWQFMLDEDAKRPTRSCRPSPTKKREWIASACSSHLVFSTQP